MNRRLRIAIYVIVPVIAFFSVVIMYDKQPPAKPTEPELLPVVNQRPVRIIEMRKKIEEQYSEPIPSQAIVTPAVEATKEYADELKVVPPVPPALEPLPKPTTDFCEKHHMHKRYFNNGKAWRCVR